MERTLKQMFDESREKWGLGSQIAMFVEEANEASVAAMHLMRLNKPYDESLRNFAEELADLQFMIDEMVYYFKTKQITNLNGSVSFFDFMVACRKDKEKRLNQLLGVEG